MFRLSRLPTMFRTMRTTFRRPRVSWKADPGGVANGKKAKAPKAPKEVWDTNHPKHPNNATLTDPGNAAALPPATDVANIPPLPADLADQGTAQPAVIESDAANRPTKSGLHWDSMIPHKEVAAPTARPAK